MKNNTLSVKKLTKNLILRTLRQLYAVSEIIILIRWVTPPQKLKIFNLSFSSVFEIPQLFMFFNFALSTPSPSFFFIGYIYIWVYVLYSIHLWLMFQGGFSAKWMWSDPSPSMLNSTQSIHKFFMCVLFETRSKSSLCPCQLKNLRTKLWTYLIWIFGLPLKLFHLSRYIILFTHDRTRSSLLYTWVTHVTRMRRVRGTFVQFLRANRFSPWL